MDNTACTECKDCKDCTLCVKCANCISCVGLHDKQEGYWLLNRPVTKEKFEEAKRTLQ